MKLSIDKNDLVLKNQRDIFIKFSSPDKAFSKTISAYYKRLGVSELDFSLSTVSSGCCNLIFSTGYQVLISPVIAFELANRMILLNDKLKLPTVTTVEADEEEASN